MSLIELPQTWLLTAFLVFVRLGAFLTINPLFGAQEISIRLRLVFSLFLTAVVLPSIPVTLPPTVALAELTVRVAHETFIGVSLGMVVTVLFALPSVAGQVVASTCGLQMANMLDPTQQTQLSVVASMKSLALMLVFLALDFHHILIQGLVYSFQAIPPGGGGEVTQVGFYVAQLFSSVMETGLLVSLPVLLVSLLMNVAMGIIARVAPQMNVFFAVGSTLNELLALAVLGLSLPFVVAVFARLCGGLENSLIHAMKLMQ